MERSGESRLCTHVHNNDTDIAAMTLPAPPDDLLRHASLFLDFDGTLVDLAPRPQDVAVDGALLTLVQRLSTALDGRIAIVTGRSVDQIRGLFGDLPFPVSGSHGLELRGLDGFVTAPELPASFADIAEQMHLFADANPGVIVETKPFGLALHYRQAPAAEAAANALAATLAHDGDLHLQPGKMMVEVRLAGADKGTAVAALMADPAMAGGTPVFIGDDLTDEPAFVAAARLGGSGILVGPDRETAARYRLHGVAETLAWLATVADQRS
jgi:trehalose 6-phosphate phosphatase